MHVQFCSYNIHESILNCALVTPTYTTTHHNDAYHNFSKNIIVIAHMIMTFIWSLGSVLKVMCGINKSLGKVTSHLLRVQNTWLLYQSLQLVMLQTRHKGVRHTKQTDEQLLRKHKVYKKGSEMKKALHFCNFSSPSIICDKTRNVHTSQFIWWFVHK